MDCFLIIIQFLRTHGYTEPVSIQISQLCDNSWRHRKTAINLTADVKSDCRRIIINNTIPSYLLTPHQAERLTQLQSAGYCLPAVFIEDYHTVSAAQIGIQDNFDDL